MIHYAPHTPSPFLANPIQKPMLYLSNGFQPNCADLLLLETSFTPLGNKFCDIEISIMPYIQNPCRKEKNMLAGSCRRKDKKQKENSMNSITFLVVLTYFSPKSYMFAGNRGKNKMKTEQSIFFLVRHHIIPAHWRNRQPQNIMRRP